MERISKRQYYLDIAAAVAARSTCLRKHYGAVIVKDDRIVSTGYNGSPRGEVNCCDVGICYAKTHACPIDDTAAKHGSQYGSCVAVHAEQNAIISASAQDLKGATLYLVGYDPRTKTWIDAKPCNMCNRMILNAGISKVVSK
jgi:dCMP deaminase